MNVEERDSWEPGLRTWSQDAPGLWTFPIRTMPFQNLNMPIASTLSIWASPLPSPQPKWPLVSTDPGQGQARPSVAGEKQD